MKHAKGGFLTIALFALAATLLVFSVVGSSQAALTYFSDTYGAEVSMQDIGVTLVERNTSAENYKRISWRDYDQEKDNADEQDNWEKKTGKLVEYMLGPDEDNREELKLGKTYTEMLAVQNSGNIREYVRVSVYKYWEDQYGQKQPALDSSFIKLNFTDKDGSGWTIVDETEERTVLFYNKILEPGETSNPFVDALTLDAIPIEQSIERVHEYTDLAGKHVIETEYTYDGMKFVLKADVEAVQTHHAGDAMRSAWGVSYYVD